MRRMSEQARDRGIDPDSLIGKTVADLAALGLETPPGVDPTATFHRAGPDEPQETGYVLRNNSGYSAIIRELSRQIAEEEDERIMKEILEGIP